MDKEHTIRNGALQMVGCAEHIRKTFSAQGYKVDVVKSNDTDYDGLFVQITNIKGAIVGLAKEATGLDVWAFLNLWADGEDLKFCIGGSKMTPWFCDFVDPLPPAASPFFLANPLFYVGLWNQKRLREKVFMETMSFLAMQRS